MDCHKEGQEKFFDKHAAGSGQLKVYKQIQGLDFEKPFTDYFEDLLGGLNRQLVLEYGCGNYGDLSLKLVERGAKVVAFDISGESVRSTDRLLRKRGLTPSASALKMDCEHLGFQPDTFDLVVGRAVLHHLDLKQACLEIKRVLKKGGRAVFIEPMGMNPLINLYRRFTPQQRVPDEHPFTGNDIKELERHFVKVTHKEFNLFPLIVLALAGFFKNKQRLIPFLHKLQTLDEIAFKYFPFLSRYAWTTVITCSL